MRRLVIAAALAACPLVACTLLAPSDADLEGARADASAGPVPDGATGDRAAPNDAPARDGFTVTDGGPPLGCNSAADCAPDGGVCCASFDPGGNLQGATCVAGASACKPCCGGNGHVELLCEPDAAAACPAGQTCAGTASIAGDFRCQ